MRNSRKYSMFGVLALLAWSAAAIAQNAQPARPNAPAGAPQAAGRIPNVKDDPGGPAPGPLLQLAIEARDGKLYITR